MTEYSENVLVEQSAIDLFKDLQIEHLNCYEEKFPATLGRATKSEVVLVNRLSKIIVKLNPGLPEDAKKEAILELLRDRSILSLVKANQEIYKLMKDGINVRIKTNEGIYESRKVRIIDFENPENNDFLLVSQIWITGEMYTRRPDLVVYVNGLPLIVIELKARGVELKKAYDDNISDYKETIPHLFWYNAFVMISNGRDSRIGTITSGYEHFSEWKRMSSEKEQGKVSLEVIVKGTCEKGRFCDIVENFILYTTIEGKQVKIIAKNHQYLGVNNAIEAFKQRKENKGRLGVFWHTQGSGKSYSMIFLAQKILRKFEGNYTFVIVTDRKELDTQIYENFQNAGVVTEGRVQAESGEHLKQLLKEDHRLIFTLIHKFNTERGTTYPKLSDRDDIIIMTDEAHRTQYDILALNMRNAVPNASFIGFTGTPLMTEGEERTRNTFGDYVSIYNFRASIEDGATVPLYYENKVPELKIINPELNEDIYDIIDQSDIGEEDEERLARRLSRDYEILTTDDRLNTIASHIVNHFINRGYEGKAMVVSIDKLTTVRMYDKVQYYWNKSIEKMKMDLEKVQGEEAVKLRKNIDKLSKTDMAVVISQEQNEVKKFKEKGLDITKHRKRMVTEELDEKFKNPDDPFQIVFVCNMWMTGFDVQCLSTIYLDKPMRNHTLMQAIARANRVYKDKVAGFIVDYINVFRDLKKALAIYAFPVAGSVEMPIQSKDKLVQSLRDYNNDLTKFMAEKNINIKEIEAGRGMEKHALLDEAFLSLTVNDNMKKEYLSKAGRVIKIFRAILPHRDASEFSADIVLYQDLIDEIRSLNPELDVPVVLRNIEGVLDKSIVSSLYEIHEDKSKAIDLSKIDFEALRKRFEEKRINADAEALKNIVSYKLKQMVNVNNTRIDYLEKFKRLVDEYNLGSLNQETFFEELVKLANGLEEEDRRKVVEGLTEEELAIFDKLKKPELTEKDKSQIKKVARELLHKLQPEKLVLDWRKKQQTRAAVRLEIEKELEKGLPTSYTQTDYIEKCDVAFQHFYDNYYGDGKSVFDLESILVEG